MKPEYIGQENNVSKELKSICEQLLSEYYIENCEYIPIEKMPLTPLGKVDFNALKELYNNEY